MAIKKNELYSSLWASCDKLRGGMDASQYKDYILTLLFVKYVTDKFKGQKYADITVPEGGSFDDLVALKGTKNIGEEMDKVIAKLAEAGSNNLRGVIDNAHFNDDAKLGKGQEMVDKLTDLIAIFQRKEFDFKDNKAGGDDILGDAYEYLMRHFATESGKSKGQFYTPAEVSRVLAKVIGIDKIEEREEDYCVCDPACGSGSLLIRAADEAPFEIAIYGQEKDVTTAGLAKMNLVLHNRAAGEIKAANTFSAPQYFEEGTDDTVLKRFDFIVANPPFSLKNWKDGLKEEYGRFDGYGDRPPEKNGDLAWLMHILKSLKNKGKAAVILPHGVLFRGNAEATIRQAIVDKGYIKGIIGLPANLFYGTGIAACIIVIDKEDAENRKGIFMIDASNDFIKDGNKNRLRERDVYKIVKTFNEQITTDPKYARFVPNDEIKITNGYNLNIPRYIDSTPKEDLQDINAHLNGGIPAVDIDSMDKYWTLFPNLKNKLFSTFREECYLLNIKKDCIKEYLLNDKEISSYVKDIPADFYTWLESLEDVISIEDVCSMEKYWTEFPELKDKVLSKKQRYYKLNVPKEEIRDTIYHDEEFTDYAQKIDDAFGRWIEKVDERLKNIDEDVELTEYIKELSQLLIAEFEDIELVDKYDVYEVLLSYWQEVMSDDVFVLMQDGYSICRDTENIVEEKENKKGEKTTKIKGWEGKLIPKTIIENKFFENIKSKINEASAIIATVQDELDEFVEEQSQEDCVLADCLNDKGEIDSKAVTAKTKKLKKEEPKSEEYRLLLKYDEMLKSIKAQNKLVKDMTAELDDKVRGKYAELTDEEVKELLVNSKWYYSIFDGIEALYKTTSNNMTSRIIELAERYEEAMPDIADEVSELENKVKSHLERMGFVW